ncbi:hypothetical protein [Streptantibioticus silvisoli]|uniref:PqqD family protein n=1 Tax=Streptantibioticus silvisoli TaxID=2705255 RepID=A0ABT6VST8_9ACTN|nr:hypothetical protein [Streptantibioticus silvisoli]MDI5961542.1 hypothetical protein [Streptantibioticus silvisoli]
MATVADEGQQAGPAVFDPSRPVPVHPLTYLDEGDEVTVGRREAGTYVVLPADGAALLRRLEAGATPAEAAAWYRETYGEPVDMADFCDTLGELGFLRAAGEDAVADEGPVRWQRLGRALFSLPGALLAVALLAFAVVEMLRVPGLAPRYTYVFFSRSMVLNGVVLAFGQIPLVLLHEAAHALAGRRLGLRSHLSIGRRLYYLVFLTELNGLVTVERRKRYLPMLAGMITDVLVAAALVLAADAIRQDGHLTMAGRMLLAVAYFTLVRILWQFLFYLETDLYYVAVTVLGCVDLQTTARRVAYNNLARLAGRRTPRYDESVFHPRDREVARWYSWLVVVGYAVSIGMLLMTTVPMITMIRLVFGRFLHPAQASTGGLVDSGTFVLIILAQVFLLLRPTLQARRAARAATADRVLLNGES